MHPAIVHLGKSTLYKAAVTAFSSSGKPTFAAATSFTGYVERATQWQQTGPQTTENESHKIYTETEIKMDTAIWMPWMNYLTDKPRFPKAVDRYNKPGTSTVWHYVVTV